MKAIIRNRSFLIHNFLRLCSGQALFVIFASIFLFLIDELRLAACLVQFAGGGEGSD